MNLRVALFWAALPVAAAAFQPYATLSVEPKEVVLTESAEATIRIYMPQPFQRNPSIHADFIPERLQLTMERGQVSLGGTNAWRYTVKVPVKPEADGVKQLGPVVVSIPTRTDFFGFVSRTFDFRSGTVELKVLAPPELGRPKSYCGAISREFAATASLDTNVCTAGDPLLFTLEISGATDPSMVHAPPVAEAFRGSPFKLDAASLKTETLAASKRFSWRVRAVKAGTVEFPSVTVAYFDTKARAYRTVQTEPIPIQVKAGEQAALGALDEAGGETDEFPMPDGLDLPFEVKSFTLKHALSLAFRAETEADFRAAAERYAAFVESLSTAEAASAPDGARFAAVHAANLGALYLLAGKPRESLKAYERAELLSGATVGTTRGVRAALARLKNDPRVELPLPRLMFPFWYRFALKGRILFSMGVLLGLALLFGLALRAGRRLSVWALCLGAATAAQAWPFGGRDPFAGFFDDMSAMRMGRGVEICPVQAKAWFSSTAPMVGEPVDLVVMVEPGTLRIEPGSIKVEADIGGEKDVGQLRNDSPNVYKVRVTFLGPGTNEVPIAVSGVYSGVYCVTNGNMISSGRVMNQPFRLPLKPVRVAVKPLPSHRRPDDFAGAVGRMFKLRQRLTPDHVHPGDLVTAEYTLDFDGYCPSNAEVRVENLSREFKAYDVKEAARSAKSVSWRQILVPRTTEATNAALVSFSYYNLRTKRYERASAAPAKLTFVSAQAASTENTRVMVNTTVDPAVAGAGTEGGRSASLTLRFAPHAKSPVVVTLPPGTETRETGRHNGWRRLESSRGAGWVKP